MELKREISAGMMSSLVSDSFHPVALVYLDWPTGPTYVHTGTGTIVFGGNNYLGIGVYGSIEVDQEAIALAPGQAVLILAGTPETLVDQMGVSEVRGLYCDIRLGTTTTAGGNVLTGNPTDVFAGYVDARDFLFERNSTIIKNALVLTLASGAAPRAGASVNHSQADQKSKHPDDTWGRHSIYAEADLTNPPKW